MRRRCRDVESLLHSLSPPTPGGKQIPPGSKRRWQALEKLKSQTGRDCQRALAAIESEARIPDDVECVRQQLLEAVPIRVRELSAAHAWGSTSAVEWLFEPELETETIDIPVETDSLPHNLRAVWKRSRISIGLEFRLSHVKRSPAGGSLAVYRAELKC
jgi:hypothetical protein